MFSLIWVALLVTVLCSILWYAFYLAKVRDFHKDLKRKDDRIQKLERELRYYRILELIKLPAGKLVKKELLDSLQETLQF